MTQTYNIRQYESGDERQIVDLLDICFNGWPNHNIEDKTKYWKWKYQNIPLKKPVIVLAENNQEIIACSHCQPREIQIGKQEYLLQFGGDAAVHPDFRRRGIYNQMYEETKVVWVENQSDFNAYATANPILIEQNKRLAESVFPVTPLEMINIKNVAHEKLGLVKGLGYKILQKINRNRGNKLGNIDTIIKEINKFGDEANVLWENTRNSYNFIVKRDAEWLNWRYCASDGGDFKVFASFSDSVLMGYCVTRINKKNLDSPIGLIVDLLTCHEREDVAYRLMEKACEYFDENSVNVIKYLVVQGHPYEKMAKMHGFVSRPSKFSIGYIPISKRINDDLHLFEDSTPEKLLLHYGDTDLI